MKSRVMSARNRHACMNKIDECGRGRRSVFETYKMEIGVVSVYTATVGLCLCNSIYA